MYASVLRYSICDVDGSDKLSRARNQDTTGEFRGIPKSDVERRKSYSAVKGALQVHYLSVRTWLERKRDLATQLADVDGVHLL